MATLHAQHQDFLQLTDGCLQKIVGGGLDGRLKVKSKNTKGKRTK
jgi:hypothetical protein